MKKYLLVVLLVVPAFTCAQQIKGEIAKPVHKIQIDGGVGFVTLQAVAQATSDALVNNFLPAIEKNTTRYQPAFWLEASYRLNERIDLGVHYSRSQYVEEYSIGLSEANTSELTRRFNTFMLLGRYYWVQPKENLDLYSGLQLGLTRFVDEEDDVLEGEVMTEEDNEIAIQVTVLGARYGGTLGVAAELGFGYKGLIALGLSLRL